MVRNAFWNVLGAIVRGVSTLLAVPLLLRSLGLSGYGLWSWVMAVISIACLGETGIAMSTTVFVVRDLGSGDRNSISATLTAIVSLLVVGAAAISVVLAVGARFMVSTVPSLGPNQVADALKALYLGIALVWVRLSVQIFLGIEQAFHRYGAMNGLLAIQTLFANFCLVVLAWRGGSLPVLLAGYLVISVVALLAHGALAAHLLRGAGLRVLWNRAATQEILHYNVAAWLAGLGSTMFGQVDRVIVGAVLGSLAVGLYAAVTSVVGQINTLSALPVQPVLAESGGLVGERKAARGAPGHRAVVMNAFAACALGSGLVTCGPAVLRGLFGATAGISVTVFTVAVVIYTLYSLNAAGYYILFALGEARACMVVQLTAGSLALLLIGFGARIGGLLGAVAGNVGYFGVFGLTVVAMRRLGIAQGTWVRWMAPFVLAFAAALGLAAVAPQALQVRGFLVVIEGAVFCGLLWQATQPTRP